MHHYELVVILSPILSQEEADGSWDKVKELVLAAPGEITHEQPWGMRRLAYPIRKAGQMFLEGNYLLTRFSTEKAVAGDLETYLKMSENVLRYLLVKSLPQPPTPPISEPVRVEPSEDQPPPEAAKAVGEEPVPDEVTNAEKEEVAVAEVAEAVENEPPVVEVEEAAEPEPVVAEVEEAAEPEPVVAEVTEVEEEEPIVAEAEEAVVEETSVEVEPTVDALTEAEAEDSKSKG